MNRTDPVIPMVADSDSRGVVSGELDTGSVGDHEVAGVDQRDVSSLTMVVECLCLHRTRSCSLRHTAGPSLVAKDGHLDLLESRCTLAAQT